MEVPSDGLLEPEPPFRFQQRTAAPDLPNVADPYADLLRPSTSHGGRDPPNHLSLARLSIWLLQMGMFDKSYAQDIDRITSEHAYLPPELFHADTSRAAHTSEQLTRSSGRWHQGITGFRRSPGDPAGRPVPPTTSSPSRV